MGFAPRAHVPLIILIFIVIAGSSLAECFKPYISNCENMCKVWIDNDDSLCKYNMRNCYNECWPDFPEGCVDKCTSEDWKAYEDYLDCLYPPPEIDPDCIANCTAENAAKEKSYQDCLSQVPEDRENRTIEIIEPPECSGIECCEYEEYKNTALCLLPPKKERTCSNQPPLCPMGASPTGVSGPYLINPGIASGSKCRGACGPDCPSSCKQLPDYNCYITDSEGCFYMCMYGNVIQCGSHDSCQEHDACYDACAAGGETMLCPFTHFLLPIFNGILDWLAPCHCRCDDACIWKYGASACLEWMNGKGDTPEQMTYSTPPLRSGALINTPGVRPC